MTTNPDMIIKIPEILFTQLRPTKSSFLLESIVLEVSKKNPVQAPLKTLATRITAEKN